MGLDDRLKKANEFYTSLKSKGYLEDSSINAVVKETCANIARYEVSNELFDSALDYLRENLEKITVDYFNKVREAVESASNTLEFVVDENPQGADVISFTNLARLAYNKIKDEVTGRKPIILDLKSEE